MRRNRTAIALSAAALAVAVLGQTQLGQAAANAVRVSLFAQNAGKVNNIKASRTPTPGRLLPLDAHGKLPAAVLPSSREGKRGPQGPPGPEGPRGERGPAGAGYIRTLIVHPATDPAKSGNELIGALASIVDNSATNPYLVKIEPGIYDLGARSLALKQYVDVEGSGELVTTISSSIVDGLGTVVGSDHSELRFVTVKNTGGGPQAIGLYSDSTSPRYTHVTASASGASENYGLYASNGAPVLTDVTAIASGGGVAMALTNFGGNVSVTNTALSASDAAGLNAALRTTYGGSVKVLSSILTASGGAIAMGMRAYNGSHSLANVTVSATGASQSYGLFVGQKSSAPTVTVNQSRVTGQSNSVYSVGGAVRIGASQLVGPAGVEELGTVVCAVSYGGDFSPLGPACD